MHYTNKSMMPLHVLRGITHSWTHDKKDAEFSVTELLQPPKIRALKMHHKEEITDDYSSTISAFIGTAVHKMLEDANKDRDDLITEQNLIITIDDCKISGTVDLIDPVNNVITDYKTTGSYGVAYPKAEWEMQLNIYAYMYATTNKLDKMPSLEVCAILKDWSPSKAQNSNTYPPSPIFMKPIPLWDKEKTESFIRERIKLHRSAVEEPHLFDCTDEERWLSSRGVYNRCENFCLVNKFCKQFNKGENDD